LARTRKRVGPSPPSYDPTCSSPQRAESALAVVLKVCLSCSTGQSEATKMLPLHVAIAFELAFREVDPEVPRSAAVGTADREAAGEAHLARTR